MLDHVKNAFYCFPRFLYCMLYIRIKMWRRLLTAGDTWGSTREPTLRCKTNVPLVPRYLTNNGCRSNAQWLPYLSEKKKRPKRVDRCQAGPSRKTLREKKCARNC